MSSLFHLNIILNGSTELKFIVKMNMSFQFDL